eukprot:5129622-Pyramimonas_sp.AAC.1
MNQHSYVAAGILAVVLDRGVGEEQRARALQPFPGGLVRVLSGAWPCPRRGPSGCPWRRQRPWSVHQVVQEDIGVGTE